MTVSVDEQLSQRVTELAKRTGLSSSGILNICLRTALPKLENGTLVETATPARKPLAVLIVEDSDSDAELLVRALRRIDFEPTVQVVKSLGEMQGALKDRAWDLVLADWVLPDFSGLEALELYRRFGLKIPFIIVSGRIGEEAAVEAMRSGADDYVLKDRWETLGPAVQRAMARRTPTRSSLNAAKA